MKENIYLDFNASTPLRPNVKTAMVEAFQHFGNPSSVHKFGRKARACIENSRDIIAKSFAVEPSQIIFTSGGTEANNLIIKAAQAENRHILISAIEHKSIHRPADGAAIISVNSDGRLNLDNLEKALSEIPVGSALVSVMLANNETGIIQPLEEIVNIARRYQAQIHSDAVTAYTKIPFTYKSLGVDYLTISAHKIGGPKGTGALVVPFDRQIPSLIQGSGQEKGHRSGTENVTGIVGFAQAVEDAPLDDWSNIASLRDQMEQTILAGLPEAPIYGIGCPRLPNTSYLGMPGAPNLKQLLAFDLEGFAVSSGSACSSGKVNASYVLQAMGHTEGSASEAIRVSLGWSTTEQEIDLFTKTWLQLYNRFRTSA